MIIGGSAAEPLAAGGGAVVVVVVGFAGVGGVGVVLVVDDVAAGAPADRGGVLGGAGGSVSLEDAERSREDAA